MENSGWPNSSKLPKPPSWVYREVCRKAGCGKSARPVTRQLAGDIIIATDRWTVYPVVSAPNFKERFYFIQDYEPYFYPVGENYLTTEQTYHMGLCGLCA
jgi:hypothetical protein